MAVDDGDQVVGQIEDLRESGGFLFSVHHVGDVAQVRDHAGDRWIVHLVGDLHLQPPLCAVPMTDPDPEGFDQIGAGNDSVERLDEFGALRLDDDSRDVLADDGVRPVTAHPLDRRTRVGDGQIGVEHDDAVVAVSDERLESSVRRVQGCFELHPV